MLNNKGPLMFINTVNTQIDDSKDQKIYDSRENLPKKHKINVSNPKEDNVLSNPPVEEQISKEPLKPRFIEERKIRNIIEMYHKDRPVLCNIISGDLEIIGIPYKLDDCLLYVKTSEDQSENIKLDDITDIIIIKF
ncbi:MAG: hypothetical protein WC006_07350 [Bacilli bacterium]|nr:hypothetical protein [Bacilli bacterium]